MQGPTTKAERLRAFQAWELATARAIAKTAGGELRLILRRLTHAGSRLYSVIGDGSEVPFPSAVRRRYMRAEQWAETGEGRCPIRPTSQ